MKKRLKGIAALAAALVMVLALVPAASATEATDSFSKTSEGYICQGDLSMTDTVISASFTARKSSGAVVEFPISKITVKTLNSNGLSIATLFEVNGDLRCSGSAAYESAAGAEATYEFLGSKVETLRVYK